MVGAGKTTEATLGWVVAVSVSGETESDPPGVDDVSSGAGEVEGVAAVVLVASGGGGGGGLLAVCSAVAELSGSPPSTGGAADPDEGTVSASEVPLGGVGVQLAAPMTLSALRGVTMGATCFDGNMSAVAVTPHAAAASGPDERTIEAGAVGVQDTTLPAEGAVSELALARGVVTAGVNVVVVVVVVIVAEVVARAGGCDAAAAVAAAATALVTSTEAANEDAREETCCESFPPGGGGSAAAVVAGETIWGETLQDVVSDAESPWTGRGGSDMGEGAGAASEAGVVPSMFDSVDFTLVETEDLESGGALGGAGSAGVGFTLGGDAVVVPVAGSSGAVELGAGGGTAGTKTQGAWGGWAWAGRGGATPWGAAAN